MRRIDIPDSESGTHFQTVSVADKGLGGDGVFLCESTLSINALFWTRTHYIAVYPPLDQLRS